MKLNFLYRRRMKILAAQLRRPSGWMAKKLGLRMNRANAFLYEATLNALQLRDEESVLEIGFGNGHFFEALASKARGLKLSGLDFSTKMLQAAKKFNLPLIRSGQLDLRLGNSDAMPFPDQSFDKIFCVNVIYFWNDPGLHLAEIFRVLKPGGRFYAVFRDRETMMQMPFAQFGFIAYAPENWQAVLENNRFRVVECREFVGPEIKFAGGSRHNHGFCMIAEKSISHESPARHRT